eukprot:TRINITY_DN253_c2_g1_i1.p1 TRINITY_DN253_c2_g1~~TRINITY_DN253_c2_g1_i1.p1  ORF type:complete len:683 (+),score=260.44 TRINITY_DN253_c2_g1_i1:64-2112(+)
MMRCLLALLFVSSVFASNELAPNNAVSKVVDMLRDLKGKIEADDKADQTAFDKYMCWCDRVQESKTILIKEAEAAIEHLNAEIKENEGEKDAQVATLEDIDVKQKGTEDKKDKENEEYDATHVAFLLKEAQQTQILQALHKSVGLLGDSPFFLQLSSETNAAKTDAVAAALSGKYVPKSLSVSGILEDMKENFGESLAEDTDSENKKTEVHTELVEDFDGQLSVLHKSEVKTESDKADTETVIADDTELKEDTTEQKEADTAFLAEAEQSCVDRRGEYNVRQELRLKELDGVTKALGFLTDESNRALFEKSVKSFLQEKSVTSGKSAGQSAGQVSSQAAAAQKAFAEVKAAAAQKHSSRLAALAKQIEIAQELPNGGFTAVLGSIDDMLKRLNEEGDSDASKKDYCKEEYQKINSERNNRKFLITKNEAIMKEHGTKVEELLVEKAQSRTAIEDAEKELADAKAIREEENSVYKTEKADDEAAIDALTQARAMLAKFYAEETGGDGTALAKTSFDPRKLSSARRDLMRDEEKYQLTGKTSQKGAATMILSMIDRIVSNSKDEISDATKAEEDAQKAFDAQEKDTKSFVDDMEKKITSIDGQVSARKEDSSDENMAMADNQAEIDAQNEYEENIKPECDWIISKFDERYNKREAEKDSLQHAKELLSGSVYLQESGKKQLRGF